MGSELFITIGFIIVLSIVTVLVLVLQFRKSQESTSNLALSIQNFMQTFGQEQGRIATLNEKVSRIEHVTDALGGVQIELRGLVERTATVEQNQTNINQVVTDLAKGIAQTGITITSEVNRTHQQANTSLYQIESKLATEISKIQQDSGTALIELRTLMNGLTETTAFVRSELSRAKNDLTELQATTKSRQLVEQKIAESIHRLESIIAGTHSKGSAGENILEVIFAKLPAEWQVRDFKISGKSVEFALKLPNNLILPIDSKWTATNLLEQFASSDNIERQTQLKYEIEKRVLDKAKEVRKYIEPSQTTPFGIAAVPDAVYELCSGVQADAFKLNVVLISYSMFLPYLLLVFQTTLRIGHSIDLQQLEAHLQTVQVNIEALRDELDGRFSKAITMLSNSRDEIRVRLGKASSSLTSLQINASTTMTVLPETTLVIEPS